MRYRTLASLLVLTAGDYWLWNWSLGAGHDVLALAAGLTLVPFVVVCAGWLGVAGLGLLARLARRSSTMTRSMPASSASSEPARQAPIAESRSSSDRLAA